MNEVTLPSFAHRSPNFCALCSLPSHRADWGQPWRWGCVKFLVKKNLASFWSRSWSRIRIRIRIRDSNPGFESGIESGIESGSETGSGSVTGSETFVSDCNTGCGSATWFHFSLWCVSGPEAGNLICDHCSQTLHGCVLSLHASIMNVHSPSWLHF